MKSDFLEKIIPIENEEKRILINNMSKLLDESIDDFINLRERQKNEIDDNDIKLKMINKFKEFVSSEINEHNNNNASSNRNNQALNHASRLERIRNMEEETERLNRLIENDYLEIIG